MFAPSEAAPGAADESQRDVGWERMSSVEEVPPPPPTPEELRREYEEKAGPLGGADAPPPA